MLREWVLQPLQDRASIVQRQDAIESLYSDPLLMEELQETLQSVKDLERTIVRLNLGSANGRDLRVLQKGLEAVPDLRKQLESSESELIQETVNRLNDLPELTQCIAGAIVDDPPPTITEGGVIRKGYSDELDEVAEDARLVLSVEKRQAIQQVTMLGA